MSEIVKEAQSYAIQKLAHTPAGKEVIRRTAMCPIHTRMSNEFRGLQKDIEGKLWWTFLCKEKGRHMFNAKPDRSAPTTVEGIEKWKAMQRQAMLKEATKGA